jgi:drug/metabolite transporter (DMT)-like permease
MTWQIAITLQIFMSAFMTMFTRRLTLSTKQVFFGVGVASYFMVALCGLAFSLIYNHALPALPSAGAWVYILIEGLCVPAAWLIQYKLIGYIGAGNAITVGTLNTISTALLGIMFLNEGISINFIIGALFIITSTLITLRIRPDLDHRSNAPFTLMLALVITGATLFATGMYFEKMAINTIGVWNYSAYGWSMQLIGAALLFILFGRKELPHINRKVIKNGLLLGLITSIAGGLYIYALSMGSLSHTIVATSGKVAITVLLSAVFLKERNNLPFRITAFLLSMIGLWLVVY